MQDQIYGLVEDALEGLDNLSDSSASLVAILTDPGAASTAYLDAWQSVDSDEGVPLAVAKKAFGKDPKEIIEELNTALIA